MTSTLPFILIISACVSWCVLVFASTRVHSRAWSIAGTAVRIFIGVVVASSLQYWAPTTSALWVAVVTVLVLISAEMPGWWGLRFGASEAGTTAHADAPEADADGNGSGSLDDRQRRFLDGLLSLKEKSVAHAMVTREHMVTVNQDWSAARAVRAVAGTSFARIPVVGRDPGEVVGVVHRKDLLLLLHTHQEGTFVRNISREVDFVPSSQRLDRLLVKFQTERVHLAVVPDEWGHAAGLITMDDILTEAFSPRESV